MKRPARPAYVSVDVETTGLVPGRDQIYEIALLSFDEQGEELGCFESLCRPQMDKLSKRLAPVEAAPSFEEIAGSVVDWLQLTVLVGHNLSFDLKMISAELARLGAALPALEYIDTLELVVELGIDSPNNELSTLCHVLGIEEGAFHSAAADALAASHLLTRLRTPQATGKRLASLPRPRIFPGTATHWPELPGRAAPLVRDVVAFPPARRSVDPGLYTESPDDTSFGVTITLDTSLSPELQREMDEQLVELARKAAASVPADLEMPVEMVMVIDQINSPDFATALAGAKALAAQVADPDDELEAAEADFKKGRFVGAVGLARFIHIVEVFAKAKSVQLADATLALARLTRFEPGCGPDEVEAAYRAAFEVALAEDKEFLSIYGEDDLGDRDEDDEDLDDDEDEDDLDDEDDEDKYETATPVLDEWLDYLQALKDRERRGPLPR